MRSLFISRVCLCLLCSSLSLASVKSGVVLVHCTTCLFSIPHTYRGLILPVLRMHFFCIVVALIYAVCSTRSTSLEGMEHLMLLGQCWTQHERQLTGLWLCRGLCWLLLSLVSATRVKRRSHLEPHLKCKLKSSKLLSGRLAWREASWQVCNRFAESIKRFQSAIFELSAY